MRGIVAAVRKCESNLSTDGVLIRSRCDEEEIRHQTSFDCELHVHPSATVETGTTARALTFAEALVTRGAGIILTIASRGAR